MPRVAAVKNYFTFIAGLITEANPLTYPENASFDEENMDLVADGSRVRRLGVDYELGYAVQATAYLDATMRTWKFDSFEWRGVGGDGQRNHLIIQTGRYLHVHDLDVAAPSAAPVAIQVVPPGGGAPVDYIDMYWFTSGVSGVTADQHGNYEVDIAFGKGVAYIVSPVCETFMLKYDSLTGVYSVAQVTFEIRDLQGINDGTAVDLRPAVLTNEHQYNLLNQGWNSTLWGTYFTAKALYPSDADMWIHAKDASSVFQPTLLDATWFGSTPAPKGHYIYQAFNITKNTYVAALGTTYNYTTTARPSTCEFYSGRLCVAGMNDARYGSTIFISPVIQNVDVDSGKCYQRADPTSEIFFDLRADDGIVIDIPEAGHIYKLQNMDAGILIIAQNGIWYLRGATDSGFAADVFSIQKVSSIGCTAPKSVLMVEGLIMYWSTSGIYLVQPAPNGLGLMSQNITQTTIQTAFETIPFAQVSQVKGVYDPLELEVKWLYSTDTAPVYSNRYDMLLTYDTRLKAFYKSRYAGTAGTYPHICSAFHTLNSNPTSVNYNTAIRYIALVPNGTGGWNYTVALTHNKAFNDWITFDAVGLDSPAFLVTGYDLYQDAMRNKQLDYLFIYFRRTELTATNGTPNNQSSCLVQTRWEWSDSSSAQKWSTQEQAYIYKLPYLLTFSPTNPGTETFDYGYSVIVKKMKPRGTGKAMQLRFDSEPGKDMQLLGWATEISGETQP